MNQEDNRIKDLVLLGSLLGHISALRLEAIKVLEECYSYVIADELQELVKCLNTDLERCQELMVSAATAEHPYSGDNKDEDS